MADTLQPAAIAIAAPATPAIRLQLVTTITAVLTIMLAMVALLLTIGAWRATVDQQIADLAKRMDRAEENQRTYIPVLLGLTKDVSYLADRARREDDRLEREHRAH